MQSQNEAPLAQASDMTPPPPRATQTTEKCRPRRSLKQASDALLAKLDAMPKPTEEEIEQMEKQRAEKQLAADRRQRQQNWNALIQGEGYGGRGKRYADCRLSNYETTCAKQEHVVKELRGYCENMQENVNAGRGVVLFGPAGTGKDHLIMALAHVAIGNDLSVVWENTLDFFGTVRDSFGNNDRESEAELIRYLTRPGILILSDPLPPTGDLTEFQSGLLLRIIDRRYSACRPTWITINCSSRKEADERMGIQIMDRLVHDSLRLFCDWESYRSRPASGAAQN